MPETGFIGKRAEKPDHVYITEVFPEFWYRFYDKEITNFLPTIPTFYQQFLQGYEILL